MTHRIRTNAPKDATHFMMIECEIRYVKVDPCGYQFLFAQNNWLKLQGTNERFKLHALKAPDWLYPALMLATALLIMGFVLVL
jgi:hypothetical protein